LPHPVHPSTYSVHLWNAYTKCNQTIHTTTADITQEWFHVNWYAEFTCKVHIFYSTQRLDLFAWCVRLSRLSFGFRTHLKSTQFLLLMIFLLLRSCTKR